MLQKLFYIAIPYFHVIRSFIRLWSDFEVKGQIEFFITKANTSGYEVFHECQKP